MKYVQILCREEKMVFLGSMRKISATGIVQFAAGAVEILNSDIALFYFVSVKTAIRIWLSFVV